MTFRLPTAHGSRIALWDYKQRRAVVLVFLPELAQADLARLEELHQTARKFAAQLLVVLPVKPDELTALLPVQPPYPVLADEGGLVHRQYMRLADQAETLPLTAALFIADRFGAISRYALAENLATLPPPTEIETMLDFLGNLCNP